MTDPASAPLALCSVTRRFGAVVALDAVSMEIGAGEILALVGRSGCGKSTLLRVIAGVEEIDGGEVLLDGAVVSAKSAFLPPERRNVGFMFQDYALFPHLTARQNVAFGLKSLGRRRARERSEELLARLGIADLAARYPHMLSGGEQQRVALARALAPQPRILLMDEPFSNLDPGLRETVRHEVLALLRALGTTAIIVTHDPEEALALGGRVVLMRAGTIVEAGTGETIYRRPQTAYAASFFSRINRIPARRAGAWLESPLGRFACERDGPDALSLYIRPEALALRDDGVEARLGSHAFLGEIEEFIFQVPGLDAPLVMRTSVRLSLRVGQTVKIGAAPEDVLVFPPA